VAGWICSGLGGSAAPPLGSPRQYARPRGKEPRCAGGATGAACASGQSEADEQASWRAGRAIGQLGAEAHASCGAVAAAMSGQRPVSAAIADASRVGVQPSRNAVQMRSQPNGHHCTAGTAAHNARGRADNTTSRRVREANAMR